MASTDLTLGGLGDRDHAFYGLLWASAMLTNHVGAALLRAHDLPLTWFEVMLWLHGQREPVAVSDLGAKTLLSRSQVSRVIDALHTRGLVDRSISPTDGRSVQIMLTDNGRQAFVDADATRREALAGVFDDLLDDNDIQRLDTVWRKLKQHRLEH